MGNHAIGGAFVAVVEATAERRRTGETALDVLDAAAERLDIRGADAEFDDAPFDGGCFHKILIEAFCPTYLSLNDEDGEEFYEKVYLPFSKRFELC